MRAHRIQVTVPQDHELAVKLPDDFPLGPAEVIVRTNAPDERRLVRLQGALADDLEATPLARDPVAEALRELRQERSSRERRWTEDAPGKEG
jgi:hypothetical protein